MEHLSSYYKDCPNQHKNSYNLCDETWLEFPIGGKAIEEQILASEEGNKSRAGLGEPQSGIQVGKLTIWVRSFEIEKI